MTRNHIFGLSSTDREILHLAVPSIVTNITTPLLGLMDVAITGHMGSAAYLGAIAVGGSIFNMLYWLFGFLRMGSSGMTAQAYGSGDARLQAVILRQALTVAFCVAALMILLQRPICREALRFMDADPTTEKFASQYFYILIWGAPAMLGQYVLTGWFLGMQNSRIPMFVSIFINLSNIAISIVLVYLFRLGLTGVALGTLSAQWLGFILAVAIGRHKYRLSPTKLGDILQLDAVFHPVLVLHGRLRIFRRGHGGKVHRQARFHNAPAHGQPYMPLGFRHSAGVHMHLRARRRHHPKPAEFGT